MKPPLASAVISQDEFVTTDNILKLAGEEVPKKRLNNQILIK